jgi:hypothetical protein
MATLTGQVWTPQKRGAGWFVPSGTLGYFVERLEGDWRDTCPSFLWRKPAARKHIAAVRKEVLMG